MKIRTLLLGSVAAAGLATGAHAADLGTLTSLDTCDALGLTGLTLSTESNCLQITGGVTYEFDYGDYAGSFPIVNTPTGLFDVSDDDNGGDYGIAPGAIAPPTPTADQLDDAADALDDATQDWDSVTEAWLQVIGTASTDFGPARTVIRLHQISETLTENEGIYQGNENTDISSDDSTDGDDNDPDNARFVIDQAYVSVGDATVISAGIQSSIANTGDDEPFNFNGLFHSSKVDAGVAFDTYGGDNPNDDEDANGIGNLDTGGASIQVVSTVGDGFKVGAALENLGDADTFLAANGNNAGQAYAGTAVGVLSYSGEGISAHVTGIAGGILDGEVENYAMHAGFTGTFDTFKIRGAFAANNTDWWNGLASAQATFDMFTLSASAEATHTTDADGFGVSGAASAKVSDDVTVNVGGRYFDPNNDNDDDAGYQINAQIVATLTETLTLTGEVGLYGRENGDIGDDDSSTYYGQASVAYAPGGGFTSSLTGIAYSDGAYKATFKAGKTFE